MLHYPKILGSSHAASGRCIAFEKYDGTNLHWDWDRDFGWHAFGTRRDSFNLDERGIDDFARKHAQLRESVEIFTSTLAELVEQIVRVLPQYCDLPSLKIFTEFLGPSSFAGLHKDADPKELRLFDVWSEESGMVGPEQFVADFGELTVARVVYQGKLTGQFTEDVRSGRYDVAEGVVCKGGRGGDDLWMVKIKTNAYLERLKQAFSDRWEDYWE